MVAVTTIDPGASGEERDDDQEEEFVPRTSFFDDGSRADERVCFAVWTMLTKARNGGGIVYQPRAAAPAAASPPLPPPEPLPGPEDVALPEPQFYAEEPEPEPAPPPPSPEPPPAMSPPPPKEISTMSESARPAPQLDAVRLAYEELATAGEPPTTAEIAQRIGLDPSNSAHRSRVHTWIYRLRQRGQIATAAPRPSEKKKPTAPVEPPRPKKVKRAAPARDARNERAKRSPGPAAPAVDGDPAVAALRAELVRVERRADGLRSAIALLEEG